MGLTRSSVGRRAEFGHPLPQAGRAIALAGNPNVGKSTLFNTLTGLRQHTGNWPGKTVAIAQGICRFHGSTYCLTDLPGTYSLLSHSPEEQIARSYLCSGKAEAVIVLCDATCLERNLMLVLQILEITPRVLVCVNLMDEARKKGIRVDLPLLEDSLGVPVVGITARKPKSVPQVLQALEKLLDGPPPQPVTIPYPEAIEETLCRLPELPGSGSQRFRKLKQLEGDEALRKELGLPPADPEVLARLDAAGMSRQALGDALAAAPVRFAEEICREVVTYRNPDAHHRDAAIDRFLTGKVSGTLSMLALLALVFWLTIVGANRLSDGLHLIFAWGEARLDSLLAGAPPWLQGLLIQGAYHTTAWVLSVMLPPMAIFFPLFTLLEDIGYLPRVAFLLDRPFCRCQACGKQALTMCMGFGCNAAGVVGCRIIDSPRERLLATLTNSFVPCNGRFPLLITMLTMFFCGSSRSALYQAMLMTLLVGLSVLMTLAATRLLSRTLLKGSPSAFTLELPPYRTPQVGNILVRSILDRSLFVLGRAASAAVPAGMLLWAMANIRPGGQSLLTICAGCLEPLGAWMGLDGVILLAFLLGLPANEIVLPIVLMTYLCQGNLTQIGELSQVREVLLANGWSWQRAVCMLLFTLFHWPCSTTLVTIRKETGSLRWTLISFLLPTAFGVLLCRLFTILAG